MIKMLITNLLNLTVLKSQLICYPVRLNFSSLSWNVKIPENSFFAAQGDCFFCITGCPVFQ